MTRKFRMLPLVTAALWAALAACAPAADTTEQGGDDLHHSRSDFTLAFAQPGVDLTQGYVEVDVVTAPASNSTSAAQIELEVSNVPGGVTATLSSTYVTAGDTAQLVLAGDPSSLSFGQTSLTVTGYASSAEHAAQLTITMSQPALVLDSPTVDLSNGGATVHYTCNANLLGTTGVQLTLAGCPAGVVCGFGEGTLEDGFCTTGGGEITLVGWPQGTLPASMTILSTPASQAATYTTLLGITETTPPAPGFALSLSAPSIDLSSGSAAVSIETQATGAGAPTQIELSFSALPEGVSGQFSASTIAAGETAQLTLTGFPYGMIQPWASNVVITAWASTLTRTTNLELDVATPPALTFSNVPLHLSAAQKTTYACNTSILGTGGIVNITSCPAGLRCDLGFSGEYPCSLSTGTLAITGTPAAANPVIQFTAIAMPGENQYVLELPVVP